MWPRGKRRRERLDRHQVKVLGPNEVWLCASLEAEARGRAAAMSGEFR
jgi:hypothetical protein